MTTPCFDDVDVGATVGPLVKGRLTEAHLVRWSAAMENWHRIHYDRAFAVEHDRLPGLLVNGSLKQQFIVQMLKDWAGPAGWLWKVSFRFRAMNVVGETLRVWGRVSAKERIGSHGAVTIETGIVNEQGLESTPGTALVVLPLRGGPPVPYPFVPPA